MRVSSACSVVASRPTDATCLDSVEYTGVRPARLRIHPMIVEKDLLCSFIGTHNTGSCAGETACNPSARPRGAAALRLTLLALMSYATLTACTRPHAHATRSLMSYTTLTAWALLDVVRRSRRGRCLANARNLLATQQGTGQRGQGSPTAYPSTPAWCMRKDFET